MSFFIFGKNKPSEKSKSLQNDPVEIAYYLFSTLSVGKETPPQYSEIIRRELELCDKNNTGYPDKQTLLNRVIELVGPPDTQKQRYLLAMAYSWSHAEFRAKAIEYITLYLQNELFEDAYNNIIIPEDPANPASWVSPKNQHLSEMYLALGNAYLGENLNQEALSSFQMANEYAPSNSSTYYAMAKAYTHMNDLRGALSVFQSAKQSKYYVSRRWYDRVSGKYRDIVFWKSIDAGEKEILEKIQKGYIYRPRKKE